MSDGPGRDETEAGPDLRKLAQDWITLWQSELAGLAVDREAQETWHAMLALWAGAAAAMLRAMPRDDPAAAARGWYPDPRRPPPRPSPARGAAPDGSPRSSASCTSPRPSPRPSPTGEAARAG